MKLRLFTTYAVGIVLVTGCYWLSVNAEAQNQHVNLFSESYDDDICSHTSVKELHFCHSIEVGDRNYRYLLANDTRELSKVILIDPGGPGATSLVNFNFSGFLKSIYEGALKEDTGYVLLEDPWVMKGLPTKGCQRVSQDYAERNLHYKRQIDTVNNVLTGCDDQEYGWSQDTYNMVVNALATKHNVIVSGFVGASFAGIRMRYLQPSNQIKLKNIALLNPLSPDMNFAKVMWHQSITAQRIVDSWYSDNSEVISTDKILASISMIPYFGDQQILKQPSASTIRQRANAYKGVYGVNSLSLSKLAYFQELCAAGLSKAQDMPAYNTNLAYKYIAAFSPSCDDHGQFKDRAFLEAKKCIVVSKRDPIIPLQEQIRVFGDAIIEVESSKHDNLLDLRQC